MSSASVRHGIRHDLGLEAFDILVYENFLDTHSTWYTGNNTTIYGVSVFDMAKVGPVVLEMPVGPSAGMINDFWFRTTGIGNLGPDKSQGGKYFIVPPGYEDEVPEGHFIVRSEMYDYMFFLRGFVQDGDKASAVELFDRVKLYPYRDRAKPKPNRVVPVTGKPIHTIEPEGLEYWRRLHEVLQNNPVEARDRFFLAMLRPLGIEKGKPFAPNAHQQRLLEDAAQVGQAMAQVTSFNPRIVEARAYPDRNWMHAFTLATQEGVQQQAEHYDQLDERLHYLYLATWPAHAMNLPHPSNGQRYLECFKDGSGAWLDGQKNYRLRVPANVPAQQFWSVTVYDNATRSMTMNAANRAAVSSYDAITTNTDGTVDLYFGPDCPEGLEANCVDTSASDGWFVWFRFYRPTEPFFDSTWQLPDFERVGDSRSP